jgi:hypothetical protein
MRIKRSAEASCRHRCRHYDCMMDRGEPLPDGVTGYIDGILYHPAPGGTLPSERDLDVDDLDARGGEDGIDGVRGSEDDES